MSVNKTVIITGGNAGLGYECAKVLARDLQWQIVIASRNPARVEAAVARLTAGSDHSAVTPMTLDLASLDAVRDFTARFAAADLPPLGAIVCNAGLWPRQNQQTVDGVDLTFGVNHLGHYLLIHRLSPFLAEPARIVLVSSGAHLPEKKLARRLGVPAPHYTTARNLALPDRAPKDARIDNPAQRYATSKLCNVLCAYELARQFTALEKDVRVFALDPGLMPGTGLSRDLPGPVRSVFSAGVRLASNWADGIRLPEQSGEDLARLVTDPALANRSGLYFDGRRETTSSAASYDRALAADLWNTSSELCRLQRSETALPIWVEPVLTAGEGS